MLKQLIKQSFNLWCKKRYLKLIDKEITKRDKCYQEYQRHNYIAKKLMEEFDNQYREGDTDG